MSGESAHVDEYATHATQDALSAEHAAVWAYGLATAYATDSNVSGAVQETLTQHQARRDSAERLLRDARAEPRSAEPAYQPPSPVTDQASAVRLLIAVEGDVQNAWRAVLDRTGDSGLRRTALDALNTSAVRATRWRLTTNQHPVTEAFPGTRR